MPVHGPGDIAAPRFISRCILNRSAPDILPPFTLEFLPYLVLDDQS